MSRRLYLGKLPPDTRSDEVSKVFDAYGRIVDCRVMTGFGFIEYENAKDAEDAIHDFQTKTFMGSSIVVEFAKESRPRRDPYEDRRPRARRPPGIRITVEGLHPDVSWQDLKDFGREAGSVSFADISRDQSGSGVLEYLSRDDADRAVKDLDGRDLRGRKVTVTLDENRGGPDNYRRDDRRDDRREDRYREERYGGQDERGYRGGSDRYREDRHKEERYSRRDRSRSPRRDYEDRRRSPKRDYEEKRSSGYDYRRSGYDDEPDRRRDDRRRDEKDGRYDERPSRASNGDGGWNR